MSGHGEGPVENGKNARAEAIFFDLLKLPEDRREAEANHRCADDSAVLRHVRELLAADRLAEEGEEALHPPLMALGLATPRREGPPPPPPESMGPYQMERRIGGGGMGEVWLARHRDLDRRVAVKILPAEFLGDDRRRERFKREIRLAGKVDHPAIVRAFHADESHGALYLAMEYVEGEDFQQLVRRRGPLPPAEAAELARQAAEALREVHRLGMVHRDVKPSNLMRSVTGEVKLLDLGIAWSPDLDDPTGRLTDSRVILGTLAFMAPEQMAAAREVDIRADLYGLGATLHFLLTGEPPARIWTISGLDHRPKPANASAKAIDRIPTGLRSILARLLAESPDQRFSEPAEVVRALDRWLAEQPSETIRRSGWGKFASITLLLMVGLGTAGIVAWWTRPITGGEPMSPPEWLNDWLPYLNIAADLARFLGFVFAIVMGFIGWIIKKRLPNRRGVWILLWLLATGFAYLWLGSGKRGSESENPGVSRPSRDEPTTTTTLVDASWTRARQAILAHLEGLEPERARRVWFALAWDLPGATMERQLDALSAAASESGEAGSWIEIAAIGEWRIAALELPPHGSRRDWERRLRGYPYGLAFDDAESPKLEPFLGKVAPFVVRADWLLAAHVPGVRPEAKAVAAAVREAYDRDLDLTAAARELGLRPDQLRAALADPGRSAAPELKRLAEGGTVHRAAWTDEMIFEKAARDLLDAVPQTIQ